MTKTTILEVKEEKALRRRKVGIMGEWVYDPKDFHAWFELRKLHSSMEGANGLVADSRFAMPLSPWKAQKYTDEEITARTQAQRRIRQAFHYMKQKAVRQGQSNVIAWTVSLVVTSIVIVFIIMALLVASGKIGG